MGRNKHGTSGKHDGGVVENPRMVKGDEVVDCLLQQRMPFLGKHEVIGDANRDGLRENDGIDEKRVQGAEASNIQIQVYATVMIKDEVTYGVGTLYGVGITVESL